MILRCYNCGLQGHKTQHCPSYGPRYPAPGKTSQDYEAEATRIMGLFAADIIAEHQHEDDDDAEMLSWFRGARISAREAAARENPCTTCGAEIGEQCRTKRGQKCGSHRSRIKLIEVPDGDGQNNQRHAAEHAASTD